VTYNEDVIQDALMGGQSASSTASNVKRKTTASATVCGAGAPRAIAPPLRTPKVTCQQELVALPMGRAASSLAPSKTPEHTETDKFYSMGEFEKSAVPSAVPKNSFDAQGWHAYMLGKTD
tara:strand:- start:97 stop:456 length:360 start_codon:yes stop_codon:yes gene_type:complete